MSDDKTEEHEDGLKPGERADRRVRADAKRNIDTLLQAALAVFATSGVDAPVREIAEKAGVGIGTVYRHFPQRSDLSWPSSAARSTPALTLRRSCAAEHAPGEALAGWMQRYVDFIAAKRGLAAALHSGDPAFDTLPAYFQQRLRPALRTLLEAAVAAGEVRADVDADDLLSAVASLCMPAHMLGPGHARAHGLPAGRRAAPRRGPIDEHAGLNRLQRRRRTGACAGSGPERQLAPSLSALAKRHREPRRGVAIQGDAAPRAGCKRNVHCVN